MLNSLNKIDFVVLHYYVNLQSQETEQVKNISLSKNIENLEVCPKLGEENKLNKRIFFAQVVDLLILKMKDILLLVGKKNIKAK